MQQKVDVTVPGTDQAQEPNAAAAATVAEEGDGEE